MNPMRPNITAMAAYVPGFQPPESERFIKLNTNENPFPPSPKVIAAILEEAGAGLRKYPDSKSLAPRLEASRVYGFDPDWIIMANGSDEVLNNLIRCFAAEGEEIGYVHPSYSYYLTLAQIQGAQVRLFPLSSELELQERVTDFKGKIFFLANPNAPFGFSFPLYFIDDLASRLEGILVVDEAYVDFCDENSLELVRRHDNLVVTRTLSKSYSLAGMRIGLAIGPPPIIAALDKIRDHYNLDRLAQTAAVAALKDQDYFHSCVAQIRVTREWFRAGLLDLGYEALPSQANFLFCSPPDRNGQRVYHGLYDRRILVRHFSDPFLAHGLRISIGSREEMEATLAALREIG